MAADWDDLRFFLAVARAGRLTAAARRLGVDHATVSRRVSALEARLATRLFERSARGYAPTPAGERLLPLAEAMESAAAQISADLAGEDAALEGAVRIGAPDGFGTAFLAPRLATLGKRHPGLDLQLVAMPRLFSLSKREADIAVGLAPPTEGRLASTKLTDYRLRLYGSAAYLAEHGAPADVAELSEHRLIGYIPDLIFAPELDYLSPLLSQVAAEPGPDPRAPLTSSNLIAQLRATEAGAGLCILPDFLVRLDGRAEAKLTPVLDNRVVLTRSKWLIQHADLRDVARIRAVAEFIAEAVAEGAEVF